MFKLLSEVSGTVWKCVAQPGQVLAAGDEVFIVESMKMEIPVCCERGGTLRELRVAEGEPVAEGQWLATLD